MDGEPKSEARLAYELREADLFDRLKRGELNIFEYQIGALNAQAEVASSLSSDEALWAQRFALELHGLGAEDLARRGYSYPGNNPHRPN